MRLNETLEEEIIIVAKEIGFQEVLDRRTCKGTQDYHGDGESVTSEENALTI